MQCVSAKPLGDMGGGVVSSMANLRGMTVDGRFLSIFVEPALQIAERIAAQGEIILDDPVRGEPARIPAAALGSLFGNRLRRGRRDGAKGHPEVAARRRRPARLGRRGWFVGRFSEGRGVGVERGLPPRPGPYEG
jgi:hypothetical protein